MESQSFVMDIIPTSIGDLGVYFLGHGSLMISLEGKFIHIDPYSRVADYQMTPDADTIIITHEHGDHLDPQALQLIRTPQTTLILTELCARQIDGGIVMKNGESREVNGIRIEAVPAYNRIHVRENGQPFHPPGHGNGYILTFGDTRIYIAGDTEDIPEMADLSAIDIAFLPMNLPYTMTPEMVANAAGMFHPKILYPYHYGKTDPSRLIDLLAGSGIEVRIRPLA